MFLKALFKQFLGSTMELKGMLYRYLTFLSNNGILGFLLADICSDNEVIRLMNLMKMVFFKFRMLLKFSFKIELASGSTT